MSTYIKPGKPLEYDNAPDWLVAYMRHRLTLMGNTRASVMTDFITLREYFQWIAVYRSTGQAPKDAVELRQVDILDMPLADAVAVNRNDIETYLYFCADVLSNGPATLTKKLVAVRCFYTYVLDQNDVLQTALEFNPAERIKPPKIPKKQPIFLPEQERTDLLKAVKGENAERDYAILLLILSCGLRVSEVVNLRLMDVNFNACTIKIHGKGNKERMAYPTPACMKALENYLSGYRSLATQDNSPQAPLFVTKQTGKGITTRSIERSMQKAVNAAGIGGMGYTPHKLRHTFATMLSRENCSLLCIQELLGHESPTTTQIYTHLGSEDLEDAIRSTSSLMSLGK